MNRSQLRIALATLCAGACALVVLRWSTSAGAAGASVPPMAGRQFRVIVSGDTQSYLRPCGCQPLSPGGIARRATFISQQHRDAIRLDLGNLVGTSPLLGTDATLLTRTMTHLNYAACGIGPNDLKIDKPNWTKASKATGFSLICTNLDEAARRPGVVPSAIITAGGLRLGVLCVLAPTDGGDVPLLPVQTALEEYLPAVRRDSDVVVLLTHMSPEQTKAATLGLRGIDLVISSARYGQSYAVRREDNTWQCAVPTLGRGVMVLTLTRERGKGIVAARSSLTMLTPEVKADPLVDRWVEEHLIANKRQLPRQEAPDLLAALSELQRKSAGASSCGTCHQTETSHWSKSGHARAWFTLVQKGKTGDPTCIPCHTTPDHALGSDLSTTGIGCATCHGADDLHRFEPKTQRMIRSPQVQLCLKCHTPEQDPHFDFRSHLKRISH